MGEDHDGNGLPLAKLVLAVKLSDSTLANDLNHKTALYARHNVPEYWVVDRTGQRIVQMWEPKGNGYGEQREVVFVENISSIDLKLSINIASI